MTDISEFLIARLDEDKAWADDIIRAREHEFNVLGRWTYRRWLPAGLGKRLDDPRTLPGEPSRVHREMIAYRAVIEGEIANLWDIDGEWGDGCEPEDIAAGKCIEGKAVLTRSKVLRGLASIYSDHPDYRQEWAL